jgi:hypothetical protein
MTALRLLALAALLAAAPLSAQPADPPTGTPIHFAKGASSATVKGQITGRDDARYTLVAKAGQTLSVSIAGSRNANVNVFAPGKQPGSDEALGQASVGMPWRGALPASGSYTVQVYQMRASGRRGEAAPFSLTVGVR